MGEKKNNWKNILGGVAIACAIAVACVACLPAAGAVGIVVAGMYISGAAITGTAAVVAAVGAGAALTKAGLHLSDGEYEEAAMSTLMAVPLMGSAYAYGSMYMSQTSSAGRMTTGASSSQSSSQRNLAPNRDANKGEVEFNGKTVTQDNSLFDPNRVDSKGLSNVQRMQNGKAPIGYDGKPVNIHHMDQTNAGPVMEISASRHQQEYSILHTNTGQTSSLIDRSAFNHWRGDYWKWRAGDF